MTGYGSGLLVPPCSPLVNKKSYTLVGVKLVHDVHVLAGYITNLKALAESPIVVVVGEFGCRALAAYPTGSCVVVERDTVHEIAGLVHKHFGPVVVVVACT